jgi:hypothetical protein
VLLALLLIFLILDVVLIDYTFTQTSDSKKGVLLQSDLLVSKALTSAFSHTVIEAQGSLYMVLPAGLTKFEGSDNLTSFAFGHNSEAVAVITDHRVLKYYRRGDDQPQYSTTLQYDTEVLCIREIATGHDFVPVDIALIFHNQSGSYFVPASLSGQWSPDSPKILPGNVIATASARSGGYISIACDDGSMATYRLGHDESISVLTLQGQVKDMIMLDNGMKIFILHNDGTILVVKPSDGFIYGWTNLSAAVQSLVLGEDGVSVYTLDEEQLMLVSGESGSLIFAGEDITAFAISGMGNYVICQKDRVSFHNIGNEKVPWTSEVQGTCIGAETDFSATFILVWTEDGQLIDFDNSIPSSGDRDWWVVIGALLIIELLVLIGLAWGKSIMSHGSHGLIAMFGGAFAGIFMLIIFPSQSGLDWFGGEIPLAIIAMVSGAAAAYIAWESGSGAWGVILGSITGIITSAITGLIVMFILWISGTDFGGQDVFFYTLVNSVPSGFIAGIAGGVVGLILSYVLISEEKKK